MQDTTNIFSHFNHLETALRKLINAHRVGLKGSFEDELQELVVELQELVTETPDLVLGAIHLYHGEDYNACHQIYSGILCELLARANRWSDEDCQALVAAGLTHDIGMAYLQNLLENHQGELSSAQHAKIRQHPLEGVQFLRSRGVTNSIWLDAVLHHHERLDGSGYPNGLGEGNVSLAGQILAVADVYTAMVRARGYREGHGIREAFQQMLLNEGGGMPKQQIQLLVKTLGVFPPGSLVTLESGEQAIVVRRGDTAHQPLVALITGADGAVLSEPQLVSTTQPGKQIKQMHSLDDAQRGKLQLESLWNQVGLLGAET